MPIHSQVEWALILWLMSTVTASSIEAKLPTTMKKANLKYKKELVRSTLFDEVTWGVATKSYINSCSNIKPEGRVTIQNEALTFAKVNNRHTLLLDNVGTSTQVNDDNCGNLLEDLDNLEDMEVEDVEPCNQVWGITQGDELPLDMEEEDVEPHNWVWGIMQGDELPGDFNLGELVCSNSDKDNSE